MINNFLRHVISAIVQNGPVDLRRRLFNLSLVTTPVVASEYTTPIGCTRWQRVGHGVDPNTNQTLHEEFREEVWDGFQWKPSGQHYDWWVGQNGQVRDHHYNDSKAGL